MPVGISYYTLEAVGYLLEVYWRRAAAVRDFPAITHFLDFFPQTMDDPIARCGDTMGQFSCLSSAPALFADDRAAAAVRIVWGMFKNTGRMRKWACRSSGKTQRRQGFHDTGKRS